MPEFWDDDGHALSIFFFADSLAARKRRSYN